MAPSRGKIGFIRRPFYLNVEILLRHEILPFLAIIAWRHALDSEELLIEIGEIVES